MKNQIKMHGADIKQLNSNLNYINHEKNLLENKIAVKTIFFLFNRKK